MKKQNKSKLKLTIFDRIFFKAVWVGSLIMFGTLVAIKGGWLAWLCSLLLWGFAGKELLLICWKAEIHDEALRLFK